LLGDDIVKAETPCLLQLIQQFEMTNSSVIGIQEVSDDDVSRYGIIDPLENHGRLYQVQGFVEKPQKIFAPSNLAIMGRYILTPKIFEFLEEQELGAGGEIQLTDAIQKLNELEDVYAYDFEGTRYDVGEKMGFILTTLDFALMNGELRAPLMKALEAIVYKNQTVVG
jgi:UTP--glucose-1-phosphate uridylyltransferase